MISFDINTTKKEELIDITEKVRTIASKSGMGSGICVVFTPHTTAAITINENADPDVQADILTGLGSLGLHKTTYKHNEGNSPAHIKSSLVGCSETIIIDNGSPALGTWQGIYLCEFDGPRTRKVQIKVIAE